MHELSPNCYCTWKAKYMQGELVDKLLHHLICFRKEFLPICFSAPAGDKKQEEMGRLGTDSDFISNLPDNVIDQILIRLPIRVAVRTSVLSTKWRYKWTTITQLVFHESLILASPNDNMDKLIYFVDRVLLLHTGFIHKFELSSKRFSTIDCWILFLLRKINIKELVLKFNYWDDKKYYKLPSCLFSAQQISTLVLHGCVLRKLPPTFTGLSNLKCLYLYETTFVNDKDGFEFLISKCHLLERLTWSTLFDSFGHLNICSPNLKYLCLRGSFEDICFENTPLLSDVSIHTNYIGDEKLMFLHSETSNVVKVLSSLPSLRKFSVGLDFAQFLAVGKIPEKLHFTCHHLNNLSLGLNFEVVNELCVILCLLNSSPNLQELNIECRSFGKSVYHIENFWEERNHIDWNMSGLQVVKITDFSGFELGLEFIRLSLANSPMLEMLIFRSDKLDNDCKELKLLRELLVFPRASPKAKIKFLAYYA